MGRRGEGGGGRPHFSLEAEEAPHDRRPTEKGGEPDSFSSCEFLPPAPLTGHNPELFNCFPQVTFPQRKDSPPAAPLQSHPTDHPISPNFPPPPPAPTEPIHRAPFVGPGAPGVGGGRTEEGEEGTTAGELLIWGLASDEARRCEKRDKNGYRFKRKTIPATGEGGEISLERRRGVGKSRCGGRDFTFMHALKEKGRNLAAASF